MLACSIILDLGDFLPKKASPTGNDFLNIVEYIRYMFANTFSKLGLLIMLMVGFASYMTHIGANDAFVNIATKRLKTIKKPYLMIFVAFALCKVISMAITSATGLGVLCVALLGPILVSLGLNTKTVASICTMSGAGSMVLLGASTAASAKASGLSLLDYVFIYKIPAAFLTCVVIGVSLVFWNMYLDKKEGWIVSEHIGDSISFDE